MTAYSSPVPASAVGCAETRIIRGTSACEIPVGSEQSAVTIVKIMTATNARTFVTGKFITSSTKWRHKISRSPRHALLLIAGLVISFAGDGSAQERSIRVRNFDALLAVHSDGSLDVTEQITIGFTGHWNGINRDLSLHHNTAQGRATRLDVTFGYITDASGRRLQVEEQNLNNGWTHRLH